MIYRVYMSGVDAEDPASLEKIGERKTLAGAQALAARKAKRRIFGWFKQADGALQVEIEGVKFRIVMSAF